MPTMGPTAGMTMSFEFEMTSCIGSQTSRGDRTSRSPQIMSVGGV